MLRPGNGRAVAAAIPGARYLVIDGTGHDLPQPVWRPVVETLTDHICTFATRGQPRDLHDSVLTWAI